MAIRTRSAFGAATAVLAIAAMASEAQAQSKSSATSSAANAATDEIVVTAQRRAERLQNVPISMAVMTGTKLDASSAQGTTDALSSVAGVAVSQSTQNGSTLVTIRGVSAGNSNLNGASTVGFYIDSLPFGFVKSAIAPDLSIYDLDRIEVLRGPQGTLYGASSQNGVVRVLTHDADFNKIELKSRGSWSSTKNGSLSYGGDAALNVPIIDDMLAARLVFGYHHLGGWLDRANERDANHEKVTNARARIRFEPTARLKIGLSAMISNDDYGAPSSAARPYFDSSLISEPGSTNIKQFGATIGYDFDGFSVSEASGLLRYKSFAILDYAPPLPNTYLDSLFTSRVQSHELNVRSTGTGPWRATAGVIYRDAKDEFNAPRRGQIPSPPLDTIDESQSYAAFGEITRTLFNSRLELSAGARYFHDIVTSRENAPFDGNPATPLISVTNRFSKVSPRLVMTWHENPALTLYASYGEGFRSGFPQNPTIQRAVPQLRPVKPDNLQNFESGAKGSLFDGKLTFDADVFYIKWKGIQQTLKVNAAGVFYNAVLNGQAASGPGADLSITTTPVQGLRLAASLGWNDLKTDGPTTSGGAILFNKGERLDLSPALTGSGSAQFSFPLSSTFAGQFSLSGNYTSEQTNRTLGYLSRTKQIFIMQAGFSIEQHERWTATLFVDNLTNVTTPITPSNIANLFPNWLQRTRPRTIGVQFEYHY